MCIVIIIIITTLDILSFYMSFSLFFFFSLRILVGDFPHVVMFGLSIVMIHMDICSQLPHLHHLCLAIYKKLIKFIQKKKKLNSQKLYVLCCNDCCNKTINEYSWIFLDTSGILRYI